MQNRKAVLTASRTWGGDGETAAIIAVARSLRELVRAEPSFHLGGGAVAEHFGVDHLVVGRTGVFAIETCPTGDAVRPERGARTADWDARLRRARRTAAALHDQLRRRGFEVAVQGVVCLPFGLLERPQYTNGLIVARPAHLDYLIRHWPGESLSPTQSARVFAALQTRAQRAAA